LNRDEELRARERTHDPSRVLTLSDGVCSIIITLLVIELHAPGLGRGETLGGALEELRPSLTAFIISFVVVAIAWASHRDLFALIRRTDRGLVWLNILYLFPLCLVPFGASLIAKYPKDPVALRMYGLLLVAIALTRLGIWAYATGRPDLLFTPTDPRSRHLGMAVPAGTAAIYILAVAIAGEFPRLSLLVYAAVPVLYFGAISLARSMAPKGAAGRNFT
jgi:uncharacterized membrane protein